MKPLAKWTVNEYHRTIAWVVERWCLEAQPITLADSEPEPDIAIVRGGWADYRRSFFEYPLMSPNL